jgi:replication fork clamp-binding protein CrfC
VGSSAIKQIDHELLDETLINAQCMRIYERYGTQFVSAVYKALKRVVLQDESICRLHANIPRFSTSTDFDKQPSFK